MTDHYSIIETALATRLQTLVSHFGQSWQVSLSDERVLDKGAAEFALLYPGAFPNVINDANNQQADFEIQLDLMVRFTDYASTFSTLKSLRSDVINLLLAESKTRLSRTQGVINLTFNAEERPQSVNRYGASEGSPPVFIAQRILVTVRTYIDF